jgi:hypothetical protein
MPLWLRVRLRVTFEKIACSDRVERAGGEPDFNLETAVEREKAV